MTTLAERARTLLDLHTAEEILVPADVVGGGVLPAGTRALN